MSSKFAHRQHNRPINMVLLSTGGTIEKVYDEADGSLANRASVIMERVVNKLRLPHTALEVEVLMAKDSLQMDDADRELIRERVDELMERGDPILILHGTDTMCVTAEHLFEKIPTPRVPIVFTGAMRPLEFEKSDSIQNVTEAMMAAQLLEPGIYLSFHNRLFSVPGVRKNHREGTFEAVVQ